MRIIYFLSLLILISSCENKPSDSNEIVINGSFREASDSIILKTDDRFKLYNQPDTSIVLSSSENEFNDTLDIPKGYYEVSSSDNTVKLYLEPGYDLSLTNSESGVSFQGKGASENTYLQKRQEIISNLGAKNFPRSYYLKLPEAEFLKFVDTLEQERMNLIKKSSLAPKFKKNEINWVKVEKAGKLNTYSFGRKFVDSSYVASEDYPDALAELQLEKTELLDVDFFRVLMFTYSGPQSDKLEMERWEYILSDHFPIENKKIKEEVLYTTGMFSLPQLEKPDEFYAEAQKFLTSEEKKKDIAQRYLEVKGLEKGKKAPAFQLKNLKGELVSLEELQGSIVYIDIWTTSCGPCIQEMPEIKKLQNDFKGKDIKFVSLGLDSPRVRLEQILQKNQIEGIKLYDPEKDEEIMSKYAVTGFPRYVMLDREGKIIDHMAKRPSNPELKEQLNTLLN